MWRAAKAYTRGLKHAQENAPCQDYAGYVIRHTPKDKTPVFLGCVADGAGFAAQAHVGAKLAVRTTLKQFTKLVSSGEICNEAALQLCLERTLKLIERKQEQLAKRQSTTPETYATTLLFLFVTPTHFFAAQVGDGVILVRPKNDPAYKLVFTPHKGDHINETYFLPLMNSHTGVQMLMKKETLEFCLLATDGIENVSFDLKNWQPHVGFFKPLEAHVANSSSQKTLEQDLRKFLRGEKLRNRNQDDKTLVIGLKKYILNR